MFPERLDGFARLNLRWKVLINLFTTIYDASQSNKYW